MVFLARIRLEDLAVLLVLIFLGLAGSIPGIAPNQANEMTGAAATRLQTFAGVGAQIFVNALILLLIMKRWRLLMAHPGLVASVSLLAFWAILSTTWSQDPLLTARRSVPFGIATMFGIFLAVRFPQRHLLLLLQIAFGLLALWSALLALGFPAIGLDASTGHAGDWQGVFTQKNACGRAMVFALAAVLSTGRWSMAQVVLCAVFVAELGLSGSRGAWLLGSILTAALLLLRISCLADRRLRTVFLATVGAGSITLGTFAALRFADIALLLGRDPTLTGRTAIWHQVWLSILHRPLLGYGFSAFWRGAQGASWDVVVALKFVLFHAHNGFLEILLELGSVGLLFFFLGFARGLWLLWIELQAGRFHEVAWPSAVLLLVLLYDIDENTLLTFNGLFWVLYAAAIAQLELSALERARARVAPAIHMRAASPWLYPAVSGFPRPNSAPTPGADQSAALWL